MDAMAINLKYLSNTYEFAAAITDHVCCSLSVVCASLAIDEKSIYSISSIATDLSEIAVVGDDCCGAMIH